MDKSASLVRMRSCPGKRLTLSSRTSDRRHWCGVCPAGAIRSPRPALARALSARSCRAVFVCISFPSRGSGKRNQGVRQMCALAHAHATGMCGHDFPKGTGRVEGEGFAHFYAPSRICPAHKKADTHSGIRFFGAAGQIRTADLILTKDALYLLSYSSKVHAPYWGHVWRPRRDLNPRPPA